MKKSALFSLATTLVILSVMTGCNSNSFASISFDNNQNLFSSEKSINVVSREDGSGTRGAFIDLLKIETKGNDGTRKDLTTKEAIITNKTDIMLTSIAGDKYGIGYVSLGSLNDTIKPLSIDGFPINEENIKNGTYKISRPFNIAIKGEAIGLTKDFIDFILSMQGQEVISNNYVSISDEAKPFSGVLPSGKTVISGSSSVTPIMEKLKEAYTLINPSAIIEIQMSDSSSGTLGAIDGTCDIAMASRALKDSEKEILTEIPIAVDGIAIIVNNANPVNNISSETAKKIFTGEFTKWNEVIEE